MHQKNLNAPSTQVLSFCRMHQMQISIVKSSKYAYVVIRIDQESTSDSFSDSDAARSWGGAAVMEVNE